ncbi:MAG: hypothetical protein LBP28_05265 [Coriobacteriales bacterium]|jgi:hypothetical protein|nr:hypothetical protein [Coriobacteriales bacterium]
MSPTALLEEENALDKIVFFAFDEAREKLEQSGSFEPFTVLLAGEELYVETHGGEQPAESLESARRTISEMFNLVSAYAFCYDGYLNSDEERRDAIIVERASKGDATAEVFALLYDATEAAGGDATEAEGVAGAAEAEGGDATEAEGVAGAAAGAVEGAAAAGAVGVAAAGATAAEAVAAPAPGVVSDDILAAPAAAVISYDENIYSLGEAESLFPAATDD